MDRVGASSSPHDLGGPTSDYIVASAFVSSTMPASGAADTSSHPSRQQLTQYLSEPNIPRTECPLSWWIDNRHGYPLLAEVARRLLGIPATAVSSERLFTKEGDRVMEKRNALSSSPDRAELVLFIMENA